MAKQIWKFQVSRDDGEIMMPVHAQILHVAMQDQGCCIWALIDPGQTEKSPRRIAIYATGQAMPENPGRYLGTIHLPVGLVFHVFESF